MSALHIWGVGNNVHLVTGRWFRTREHTREHTRERKIASSTTKKPKTKKKKSPTAWDAATIHNRLDWSQKTLCDTINFFQTSLLSIAKLRISQESSRGNFLNCKKAAARSLHAIG